MAKMPETVDHQHLDEVAVRLHEDFTGVFGETTIQQVLYDSLQRLTEGAHYTAFVPLLVERFTRERLQAAARTARTVVPRRRDGPTVPDGGQGDHRRLDRWCVSRNVRGSGWWPGRCSAGRSRRRARRCVREARHGATDDQVLPHCLAVVVTSADGHRRAGRAVRPARARTSGVPPPSPSSSPAAWVEPSRRCPVLSLRLPRACGAVVGVRALLDGRTARRRPWPGT